MERKTKKWAAAGLAAAALSLQMDGGLAYASSHREAPLISEDPAADGTDLYAFRSPANETNVRVANSLTIIANYWPLEEPGGGPNFPRFSDGVLYEIKIDNDGDAVEDITYQFRFRTEYLNPGSFLLASGGPINAADHTKLQVRQRYTVTRLDKGGGSTVLLQDQLTPPAYAGDFTMGDATQYETLAGTTVYPLGGDVATNGQVFAGQRDDPFFVDLGAVFDLVRIRCSATGGGANSVNGCAGQAAANVKGVDYVGGYNVHTLALQVPISKLLKAAPTTGKDQVLGIWTTASRQRVTIRRAPPLTAATRVKTQDSMGPWVQVSRLGLPLINEVIVPVGLKDYFNSMPPSSDAAVFTAQPALLNNPELATAMKQLYGIATPAAGRTDILEIVQFGIRTSATGNYVAPFVGPNYTAFAPADILRVDVSVPAPADLSTNPLGAASQLGTVTDTNLGFPNGRRLHDDVVDIMEKVVGGALRGTDVSALTDGVNGNDYPGGFMSRFPFVNTPWSGSRVNTTAAPFPYLHTAQ